MVGRNACVVGMQWVDEGKGKIIDLLSPEFDVVVRAQGGSNAGHTVVVGAQKYVLHLIPSGILHDKVACIIGNGVVVDPDQLQAEIRDLRERGVEVAGKLLVSDRAHVVTPCHKALDAAREAALADQKIGTTLRGIGPAYADKAARMGIRMGDLVDWPACRVLLERYVPMANRILRDVYGAEPVDAAAMAAWAARSGEALRPLVGDTVEFLHDAHRSGRRILFEGAQGTLLDIDFGTYPFNTSSNSTVGGMATGSGLPPGALGRVIGVLKAYPTRVGAGPFPTELRDDIGTRMRERGGEFGSTTGRPRRCGWFDAVAARYSALVNGVDELAITKLDVLDGLDPLRICIAYEIDGDRTETFPSRAAALAAAKPVYVEMPGWKAGATAGGLCPEAATYVRRLCDLVGAPARILSIGSERGQTLTV